MSIISFIQLQYISDIKRHRPFSLLRLLHIDYNGFSGRQTTVSEPEFTYSDEAGVDGVTLLAATKQKIAVRRTGDRDVHIRICAVTTPPAVDR